MKTFDRNEDTALDGAGTDQELLDAAQNMMAGAPDRQFQTYQIPVGTSPTLVAAQPDGFVTVMNLGTQDIFLGNAQVSILSGFLLPGTKGKAIKIKTTGDVYAIAAVAGSVCVAINAEVDVTN